MSEPYTIAIVGIRDLAPDSEASVADAIKRLCSKATRFLLGGFPGVDTMALITAGRWRADAERVVLVPAKVDAVEHQRPQDVARAHEARRAVELFASKVEELPVALQSPLAAEAWTNRVLTEADAILAFTDNARLAHIKPQEIKTQPELFRRVSRVTDTLIVKAALLDKPLKRLQVERF